MYFNPDFAIVIVCIEEYKDEKNFKSCKRIEITEKII